MIKRQFSRYHLLNYLALAAPWRRKRKFSKKRKECFLPSYKSQATSIFYLLLLSPALLLAALLLPSLRASAFMRSWESGRKTKDAIKVQGKQRALSRS